MATTSTATPAPADAVHDGADAGSGAVAAAPASTSYTAVVHYPAPRGDVATRDVAVEELLETAAGHPGHLSSVILRGGSTAAPQLHLVLSFDSRESWERWETSGPARRAIARLDQLTGSPGDGHLIDSMAGWFNLPELSGLDTPPRWKSAVVSFFGIGPLVVVIQAVLGPLTAGLHPVIPIVLNAVVMTVLATYVVMPFLTRVLRGWLYPRTTTTGLTESVPDHGRATATPCRS